MESTQASYGLDGSISATSSALGLAIGNQWQWDNGFSLGCEWIGFSLPLSSSTSTSLKETGAAAGAADREDFDETVEDLEDLAEVLGAATIPRALVLSLGYAF